MVSYRKFVRENEIYLVIAGKELRDLSIPELKKIIESNKDASKIYVITKNTSLNVANYLRDSGAIVIDGSTIPFGREEEAIKRFAWEYGLKEINSF
jgi:protein associated with RNAse G/E